MIKRHKDRVRILYFISLFYISLYIMHIVFKKCFASAFVTLSRSWCTSYTQQAARSDGDERGQVVKYSAKKKASKVGEVQWKRKQNRNTTGNYSTHPLSGNVLECVCVHFCSVMWWSSERKAGYDVACSHITSCDVGDPHCSRSPATL